jgi:hypothetical protein
MPEARDLKFSDIFRAAWDVPSLQRETVRSDGVLVVIIRVQAYEFLTERSS